MSKIVLFANTDWYLYNFRFSLANELRAQDHEVILVSPAGSFQQLLLDDGFEWIPFPLTRQGFNPFHEFGSLIQLIRLYRKLQPDIIHHFTIKPVIYGSIAARILGLRAVINSITGLGHLFIDQGLDTRVLRTVAIWLYRFSLPHTYVIFENQEDRDIFIHRNFLKAEQTHLIMGTGVDVDKFHPGPKANDVPVVLFSSRLLITKGFLEFTEAARILKEKGLKARFAVAGTTDPGNPASLLDEQIDAWKQSDLLEWWGWQDDMPAALAQADIFCLPSYREGVPNALLEAAACGLPIVTTDAPGCRDVVTDNVNGLLVPIQNAKALADALEILIISEDIRSRMGAAGRKIAVEQFSTSKVNRETLAVYNLLSKTRTG